MPPSARKVKARTRRGQATEAHDVSDVETPETIMTPSRSSRKRTRAVEVTAPAARSTRRKVKDTRGLERADTEGTEPQDNSDAETMPAEPTEAEIIASLKTADRPVNATEDFANNLLEGQENVPGYGKIAGRDWAFIIRKVEVNIGRPEAQERLATDENGQSTGPSAKTIVDIDLGPDRQVSRSHAIIAYDSDRGEWFIIVNGRNGLRVDNNLYKRGAKTYLRNGSVIEIADTQMAFVTTAAEDGNGPLWDASIVRQAQKSSEDDDDGEGDSRNNQHLPPGHRANRSQLQDSSMYGNDLGGGQQRTHPHSQRNLAQAPPGTPMRTQQSLMKSSPAANYSRGVMMESTETIDYSADGAKDLKPPHSYAQLIGMAILSTTEQQMTLNNIYKWIMANYAFYRFNTGGWQNSIRHNLSLNKAFTKIARRTDEPGKGMKWMIEPTEFDNFVQQGMKGCRRPNPMPGTQSTLGSPNSPVAVIRAGVYGIKRDEDVTPPMKAYRPAYPMAMEAFTPDRGSKHTTDPNGVGLGINGDGPEYDYVARSTPRDGMTALANAAGSPPALYVNEESRVGPLDTPFPLRPVPRLAPPSTLRRPSDFIQFSSPAPFWKMEGLVGSTPFKPYDLSPLKTPFSGFKKSESETKKEDESDGDEECDEADERDAVSKIEDDGTEVKTRGSPIIHSSSPPHTNSSTHPLENSPTLSRPATAVAKTLSALASASKEAAVKTVQAQSTDGDSTTTQERHGSVPTNSRSTSQPAPADLASPRTDAPAAASTSTTANDMSQSSTSALANHGSSYTYSSGPAAQANGFRHDDGEDEGIDLAKGFQPIGTFHQRNHLAITMGMAPAQASAFGR